MEETKPCECAVCKKLGPSGISCFDEELARLNFQIGGTEKLLESGLKQLKMAQERKDEITKQELQNKKMLIAILVEEIQKMEIKK